MQYSLTEEINLKILQPLPGKRRSEASSASLAAGSPLSVVKTNPFRLPFLRNREERRRVLVPCQVGSNLVIHTSVMVR